MFLSLPARYKRVYAGFFAVLLALVGFGIGLQLVQQQTKLKSKAASTYPGDMSGKFREVTIFNLTSPTQIYGYFTSDHRSVTKSTSLPPTITLNTTGVTITKGGIVIDNPAKNEPFYRVEFLLSDNGQTDLAAYLTAIDLLWANGVTSNGVSVGIATNISPIVYWWEHTQFKTQSQVSSSEWSFDQSVKNRFLKRRTGDIKIELYVTPNGTYPVIDGVNFASFPDLYTGSYTYRGTPPNWLVLAKWGDGGNPITFKSIKIVKLDNSIATSPNLVDEVNAHFIKKTVNSSAFLNLVNTSSSFGNGGEGFQNLLWGAFLLRANDFYFHTNNKIKVQELFDAFMAYMPSNVDTQLARYGNDPTIEINHDFINNHHWVTAVTWAISDYLRPDQLFKARNMYAKIIDKTQEYVKSDGSFPLKEQYIWDTFAEETNWLSNIYGGYVALAPYDQPRVNKTLEYIKFLSFLGHSDGRSINETYGTQTGDYLDSSYWNFKGHYIWNTGEIDNHGWHPSLNYGRPFQVAKRLLEKRNISVVPDVFSNNLSKSYEICVIGQLDPMSLHLKDYKKWDEKRDETPPQLEEDRPVITGGIITDYMALSKPSLLEDWTSAFTEWSPYESYGDFSLANQVAKSSYYLYYTGTGKLFCQHYGTPCSISTTNFYNYMYGSALYSMILSPRTNYNVITPEIPATLTGSFDTRSVYYDSLKDEYADTVTVGPTIFRKIGTAGWSSQDLAMIEKYYSSPDAPCYGKAAGSCKFTTASDVLINGKYTESITVGSNTYNWNATDGWWKIDHDLASVPRYKENVHAPCYGKTAGQCKFTARFLYPDKNNSNYFVEWIFVDSNIYQYKYTSSSSGYWEHLPNHDLASIPYYRENIHAPCYGKSTGTCKFDSALRYYNKYNVLVESVTVGDKYYNYNFDGLGWWPVTNNTLSQTGYFMSENGPCDFDNEDSFTPSRGDPLVPPPLTATPTVTVTPVLTATPRPTNTTTPTPRLTLTITPTSPPTGVPGDANGDDNVDGVDYVIWLNHYGRTTTLGAQDGDFNGNGSVDGVDYVIWLNNYTG